MFKTIGFLSLVSLRGTRLGGRRSNLIITEIASHAPAMTQSRYKYFVSILTLLAFFSSSSLVYAQDLLNNDKGGTVDMTGDTVEYSTDGQKMTAKGHVIINYKGATLMAEEVEFEKLTKLAHARGNVRLKTDQGEIRGEEINFNFESMTGEFNDAKIMTAPFYGTGRKIVKVNDKKIEMQQSAITTCDLDKPHFHLFSKKIDMFPGDHLTARGTRMVLGKLPLMYIPKFTQDLRSQEPFLIFTPGYKKDFGAFLLSTANFRLSDDVKLRLHADYRELKDLAEGFDLDYKTDNFGSGLIRTYYMNERNIQSKRLFMEHTPPTIERERFRAEWRHKWQIDNKTDAIWQYYKLSDSDFLKDYFQREYDKDSNPDTFFLLTRTLDQGVLSLRSDARVNRFESVVERLPEIQYDLPSYKIGESNFYFKDRSTFSNLAKKDASPSEVHLETMRVDTDNELSYPMKVGIIEFKPFVGGRSTYYTKTKDPDKYDSIRGIFRTGASLSTKFYKLMDVESNFMGLDIHRLRHIITPSINYEYDHSPTVKPSQLDSFDSIDDLDRMHLLTFSLENKLQTKRNDKTVELLRFILESDYRLKEDPKDSGFDEARADMDFRPTDWLTLYFDSSYGTREEHLKTANFDFYINGKDKWRIGIGKRFEYHVDDQLTTDFYYKLNPKWSVKTYSRFDVDRGILKEQDYVLTRDLHEWIMDLNYNQTRGEGSEILMIFTLKAFPDMAIDVGSGFNKRKEGSQGPQ